MESFFATLKKELTFRRKYATIEDVKTDLYRYIVSICKHMPNLVMIRSTCSLYMMLVYLKRIIRLHLWIGYTKKHRNRDAFSFFLSCAKSCKRNPLDSPPCIEVPTAHSPVEFERQQIILPSVLSLYICQFAPIL